jgi:3-oxoacyl-[acyl-carrier-protein] synthase II
MSGMAQRDRAAREPVVITGRAAVTPMGCDIPTILDRLFAGESGIREYIADERARTDTRFAGPVTDLSVPPGVDPDVFTSLDSLEQYSLATVINSLADAGFGDLRTASTRVGAPRIGIVAGLGAEQMKFWETNALGGGNTAFASRRDPMIVHRVADRVGITGPAIATGAACGSSGYAMALARAWLDAGWVDVCVAGGCDAMTATSIAAFYNLRALSRRVDDPAKASRPFDLGRDGFVMSEGGAYFVLERKRDAVARGARLYGELAGVGMSSDGVHMVAPSTDPTQSARAITAAFADAGVTPDQIDYFNAHAASTPVGDVAEAASIRLACGDATDAIPVSSTKSMSGHLVSGAAAFEALACLGAIERQAAPPTVNLDNPDPECRLLHVPHVARPCSVKVTASNSFGFGGSNICLILRAA